MISFLSYQVTQLHFVKKNQVDYHTRHISSSNQGPSNISIVDFFKQMEEPKLL